MAATPLVNANLGALFGSAAPTPQGMFTGGQFSVPGQAMPPQGTWVPGAKAGEWTFLPPTVTPYGKVGGRQAAMPVPNYPITQGGASGFDNTGNTELGIGGTNTNVSPGDIPGPMTVASTVQPAPDASGLLLQSPSTDVSPGSIVNAPSAPKVPTVTGSESGIAIPDSGAAPSQDYSPGSFSPAPQAPPIPTVTATESGVAIPDGSAAQSVWDGQQWTNSGNGYGLLDPASLADKNGTIQTTPVGSQSFLQNPSGYLSAKGQDLTAAPTSFTAGNAVQAGLSAAGMVIPGIPSLLSAGLGALGVGTNDTGNSALNHFAQPAFGIGTQNASTAVLPANSDVYTNPGATALFGSTAPQPNAPTPQQSLGAAYGGNNNINLSNPMGYDPAAAAQNAQAALAGGNISGARMIADSAASMGNQSLADQINAAINSAANSGGVGASGQDFGGSYGSQSPNIGGANVFNSIGLNPMQTGDMGGQYGGQSAWQAAQIAQQYQNSDQAFFDPLNGYTGRSKNDTN